MTAAFEVRAFLVSQPGVAACKVFGTALTGVTLQAVSRAMDLAPHHNQVLQEVQEAKTHLTLQQLAEVEQILVKALLGQMSTIGTALL